MRAMAGEVGARGRAGGEVGAPGGATLELDVFRGDAGVDDVGVHALAVVLLGELVDPGLGAIDLGGAGDAPRGTKLGCALASPYHAVIFDVKNVGGAPGEEERSGLLGVHLDGVPAELLALVSSLDVMLGADGANPSQTVLPVTYTKRRAYKYMCAAGGGGLFGRRLQLHLELETRNRNLRCLAPFWKSVMGPLLCDAFNSSCSR